MASIATACASLEGLTPIPAPGDSLADAAGSDAATMLDGASDVNAEEAGEPSDAASDGEPVAAPEGVFALVLVGNTASVQTLRLAPTAKMVAEVPLPGLPFALAVSPSGLSFYTVSMGSVRKTSSDGTTSATLHAGDAHDLALSGDGATLAVAANGEVWSIATASGVTSVYAAPNLFLTGVAVSTTGLIAATGTNGGTAPAVVFVPPGGPLSTHPVTAIVSGCGVFPDDVTFVAPAQVIARDGNCDAFYQVSSGAGYLSGKDIVMTRDPGAFSGGNRLTYSSVSGRAYSVHESGSLFAVDPVGRTFAEVAKSTGVVTSSRDGKKMYFTTGTKPEDLRILDTATGAISTPYTFPAGTSVKDLAVLGAP